VRTPPSLQLHGRVPGRLPGGGGGYRRGASTLVPSGAEQLSSCRQPRHAGQVREPRRRHAVASLVRRCQASRPCHRSPALPWLRAQPPPSGPRGCAGAPAAAGAWGGQVGGSAQPPRKHPGGPRRASHLAALVAYPAHLQLKGLAVVLMHAVQAAGSRRRQCGVRGCARRTVGRAAKRAANGTPRGLRLGQTASSQRPRKPP
jgi:hypothetical protein